jgi:putative flippase GtrA/SAM-dependent methyltransferase
VGAQFVRFAAVGAIGFVVDAGVLTLLVATFGFGVYSARAVSFSAAVFVTWLVNRRWTFAQGAAERRVGAGAEYARYLLVQIMGALANLGVFVAVLAARPDLVRLPVVPLAVGAIAGLVVNYLGSRAWVFAPRAKRPEGLRPAETGALGTDVYQGTDNLEVMAEARNYNAFLVDLVLEHGHGVARAVDFGAGIGTFAGMVRDRGLDVLCVEPDRRQCDVIRSGGMAAVTDLESLPDGSVRYIYSLNVLEHIADDAAALRLLARKLAPGGRLLLYVPAFQSLYSSMDRKVGHHRRYRRAPLVAMVEAAGLRVRASSYADPLGFVATLAYILVGPGSGDLDRRSVVAFDRWIFPVSRMLDRAFGRVIGKNVYVVAEK